MTLLGLALAIVVLFGLVKLKRRAPRETFRVCVSDLGKFGVLPRDEIILQKNRIVAARPNCDLTLEPSKI